jgi:hypothetical protein
MDLHGERVEKGKGLMIDYRTLPPPPPGALAVDRAGSMLYVHCGGWVGLWHDPSLLGMVWRWRRGGVLARRCLLNCGIQMEG